VAFVRRKVKNPGGIRRTSSLLSGIIPMGIGLLLSIAPSVHAQYRVEGHPDISVQEQFDDNINLTTTNRLADLITTVSPGAQLLVDSKTGLLDFTYHMNATFFAWNPNLNYLGHDAKLDMRQAIVRGVTFRLRDNFVRSNEPRETALPPELPPDAGPVPPEYLIGTRQQRSLYIRNTVNPSLEWQYGKDDFLRLGYRDEIYRQDVDKTSDSTRDTFSLGWDHWFVPQYGLIFTLDYQRTHYVSGSDYDGQDGLLIFKRRLTPHTTVFIQGGFTNRVYEDPTQDYYAIKGSVGVEHAFSPMLSGKLRAGYFYQFPEVGVAEGAPDGEASLNLRWQQLTASAYARIGYTESALDSENLGFGKYWTIGAAAQYQATRMISLSLDGSLNHYEFPDEIRDTWQVKLGASATLFEKWLTGTLDLFHQEQTGGGTPYSDNRVTLRLTARY
jgi:hypothetical protein